MKSKRAFFPDPPDDPEERELELIGKTANTLARELARLIVHHIVEEIEMKKRLFDISDAAEYLGLTEEALRTKVAGAQIPHVVIDRRYRFDRQDLDRWIDEHRVRET
jgi:excisionase family DNA binding protein